MRAAPLVHGLWVWKGPSILLDEHDDQNLLAFCRAHTITEVYVAVSSHGVSMADRRIIELVDKRPLLGHAGHWPAYA